MSKLDSYTIVRKNINLLKNVYKLSYADIARLMKSDAGNVHRTFTGKNNNRVGMKVLDQLAKAFEVKPKELVDPNFSVQAKIVINGKER
jgi:transcriptional regulator with XRE-family HTH domain